MPPESPGEPDILLMRMRSGDREAAAEFLARFGPRVRRRIHGKLGPAMRRLFDSQEILSTLGRRLDICVGSGSLRAASMEELWSLVFRIADNSLIEKARVFRSLEAKEGEDSPLAYRVLQRLKDAEDQGQDGPLIEIDAALRSLEDGIDREILSLWLQGNQLAQIAALLGMSAPAVRKRWEKIRGRLRTLCEAGVC
jgi:DNA-directed RNA polymerase specialized sigma24 family protein